MVEEIKDLKKLSPEERIRKLRELEEKRKKEIEEAQQMMRATEDELDRKQFAEKEIDPFASDVPVMIFDKTDKQQSDMIVYGEDGEVIEEVAVDKPLEATVFEEAEKQPRAAHLEAQKPYGMELHEAPTPILYQQIQEIYNDIKTTGEVTHYQAKQLETIGGEMEERLRATEEGSYNPSESYKSQLNAGERIVDSILADYQKESADRYRRGMQ